MMTKERYSKYRRSPHWQATRKTALWRAQNRCQSPICAKGYLRSWTDDEIREEIQRDEYQLHVHHISYARLGREQADDLIALCKDCHDRVHDKAAADPETEDDPYHINELAWKSLAILRRVRKNTLDVTPAELDLLVVVTRHAGLLPPKWLPGAPT